MDASHQSSDPEHRIIARAAKDEEYRKRLIADPRRAIAEEIGDAMPANIEVKVVQETATTVYLVLPQLPPVGAGQLSDVDLQNVAGGVALTRSWFRSCPCRCSSLSVCA